VVSFSANGQDLIADGLELPYDTTESQMLRKGRWYEPKKYKKARTLIQGFSVDGVEMPGTLAIEFGGSLQMWPAVVPTEVRYRIGDLYIGHHEVSHGSLSLGSAGVVELTSPANRISVSGQHWVHHVAIGQNLLAGFDIAADRTAKNFILKKADKVKRESPLSFMIAQVQKTIEAADEAADEAEPSAEAAADTESNEATADEAEPEVVGTAKDWGMLVDLHRAAGDFSAAIEAGKNAVALDDSDCTEWSRLGRAYREAGDIGEAIAAFEKSASIYHGWYDIPLVERKEIKQELDKLEGEEKENSEYNVAVPNCHMADGALAALTFAAGDLRTVGDIYRDRMDLDTTVALAAGTALVVQGQFDQAQGPLRQALKQGHGSQAMTRLALAGAYTGKGDWATASKLFERVLETNREVQTVTYYLDALSANEGHAAAVAAAKALVVQNPEVSGAVYGLGYVALQGDDEALQMAAKEAGDRWFAAKMAVVPHNAHYAGVRARWMTLWDASAIASQKAVRGALAKDPANTNALLAKAAVHTAKGEIEEATKATIKAAQLGITHIGYAELMSTLSR
jgi:tetratricopeptide (TPR) repeat protein